MHYLKLLNIVKNCTRSKVSCKKMQKVWHEVYGEDVRRLLPGVHGSYDASADRY